MADFAAWLLGIIAGFFASLWDFVSDAFLYIFDLVVSGFVALIVAIPVPSFVSGGFASVWAALDSAILYYASIFGIPAALGILGAGYAFRFVRKAATLFQW